MGNVSFRFDQSADTVYEWVRDPEVIKRRGAALGEREIVVRHEGNAVLVERTVDAEVPSFAKKLFNPTNRMRRRIGIRRQSAESSLSILRARP